MEKTKYLFFQNIYRKLPFLKPVWQRIYKINPGIINAPPKFDGWGMTTVHLMPWENNYYNKVFQKANEDIKKNFEHGLSEDTHVSSDSLDTLLWRHWNVSFAIRYAMEFSPVDLEEYNFVECGAGDGITAFFAMYEIKEHFSNINRKYFLHLYDSWESLRQEDLVGVETLQKGKYNSNSIERTKRNLSKFESNIIYHKGYLPETLCTAPEPPNSLIYLHIDLNVAKPTQKVLEHMYPKMKKGGVILFDDYGWDVFVDSRNVIDEFLKDKAGTLMMLPTGQAMFLVK